MVMGNVSGKKDEAGTSGIKNQEDEEEDYMEYAHHGHGHGQFPDSMVQSPPHTPKPYQSPLIFTPQVPIFPLQRPEEMLMQNQMVQKTMEYGEMPSENRIPTMITWSHGGNEVAIEGSWDGWKTREFLQRTDKDFSVMKVLPSGVYHYWFIVDGQRRYAPDFPREPDDMGNVFNVLDLQDSVPEVLNNTNWSEAPPSPESSYSSAPFSAEDFNEKLPDLPPLLQQTPLDPLPSSSGASTETMQKPLPAVLNHLYIQKTRSSQSMVVLSSTNRFRTKYVTTVLYKSLKNLKR